MSPWTRRNFLIAGAAGTAGLAVDNQRRLLRSAAKPWNADTGRALRKYRDPLATVCRSCPAHCALLAFRDGDRVVQVQGASGSPTNQGGLCSRAHAGLERVYDPERVLQPLVRKGPRGSGQWEPIGWDRALALLEGHLGERTTRRVLHLGQEELLVEELRPAFAWAELLVDEPFPGRPGPGSGESLYGAPVLWPDLSRSRTVLLLGARPFDGHFAVPVARSLAAARRSGARLHSLDSLEGVTGSLATWHRVAPGAESCVAYGMARLLLTDRRFDAPAVAAHLGDAPSRLLAALHAYTPEAVERSSGLRAADLSRLADEFAQRRPSVALAPPGSPAAPAAALLNHLVGAVDSPGGIPTGRGPYYVKPARRGRAPEAWLAELVQGHTSADLYWVTNANPAYDAPQAREVSRALEDREKIATLVVMDTHLTETARLADLFLPLATAFESWGLAEGCLPDGRPYLFLQQPVTRADSEPDKLKDPKGEHLSFFEPWPRPLGEARSVSDVLLGLATRMGRAGAYAGYADTRSFLEELLRRTWGPGSLEALRRRGIWVSEEAEPPAARPRVSLARYIPAEPQAPAALSLVGHASANLPRAYANSRRGLEIAHRCEAYLHPDTAARLGVRTGDAIILQTAQGEVQVRARTIQGIHFGAVALPDGLGHWAGGAAAVAKTLEHPPRDRTLLVRRKDFLSNPLGLAIPAPQPGDPIWWEAEGPGVRLRGLLPFRPGPDGAQDWSPVPVVVRKA
ncbi:MAG: molybdopterin-dependent oxidoreductase [Deltaproteobacteria bacterium]|nr:molybdopterin-dependent oxidoreductase [Deltaproteobacteria bacterium]